MMHRMAVRSVAAAVIVMVLAGCGGSSASPSTGASTAPGTSVPATNVPIRSTAPSTETGAPASTAPGVVRMTALCAGVAVRKGMTAGDDLLVRVAKGARVRVVESVTGDPYVAGKCGQSGDDWIKIDRINGKSVQSLYGVPFGYAAGGFFQ
jgi:hypothetical protein